MNPDRLKQLQHLLTKIPRGKVTTYKEMAHAMGTKGYRYIGQLLNKNPDPDRYPCCKVVQTGGRLGGFAMGSAEKIRRLKAEGIAVKNNRIEDFENKFYCFPKSAFKDNGNN